VANNQSPVSDVDPFISDKRQQTSIHVLAVLAYCGVAALLSWLLRIRLNPDEICYIQVARHYLEGNFELAVNSWWSPAFSWILVPGIALGVEPALWARIVQIPAGLIFALGTRALILEVHGPRGTVAGFLLALCAALSMQAESVTPDIWHAAVFTWYFVFGFRLLRGGTLRNAATTGVLGGVAYLVKAYSLPFVLLHLLATCAMNQLNRKQHLPVRSVFLQFCLAVSLVMAISVPWVALISSHDRELTISSAGRYWTVVQPVDPRETAPVLRLQEIGPGRITALEDIRALPLVWRPSPPFGGLGIWKEQLKAIRRNFNEISLSLDQLDGIGLTKMLLLLSFILLFLFRSRAENPLRPALVWSLLSVLIYLSGYTLTYFTGRFLWAIWGLLILLSVVGPEAVFRSLFLELKAEATEGGLTRARRCHLLTLGLLGILILMSVGATIAARFAGPSHRRAADIRAAATMIPGGRTIAATDWYVGLDFAYWSRGRHLGLPSSSTVDGLDAELAPFGSAILLVVEQPSLAAALESSRTFKRISLGLSWIEAFEFIPMPNSNKPRPNAGSVGR
jgi:hypothetical protein